VNWVGTAVFFVFLAVLPGFADDAPARGAERPEVEFILRRLVQASEDKALAAARHAFAYEKESTTENLDADGSVKKKTVKVFRVAPVNGEPVTTLVSLNGKPAAEKEESRKNAAREAGEKGSAMNLSSNLLTRFVFTLEGTELAEGRPAWILSFVPRPGAEVSSPFDRIVNAMAGTMWVDQEDGQMSKLDLRLTSKVSFFAGFAGAIERLNMTILQRRVEPAVWLGEAVSIDFSGRRLFSGMRFRAFETCKEFRKMR